MIEDIPNKSSISYSNLFLIFLKIGCVSFGGFMSLIAMAENVIVEKYKLLSHEDVLDGITIVNLLPGPMAVNVVAYIGYRLKGGLGAIISVIAVIIPSFTLVVGLAHFYFYKSGQLDLTSTFSGITPAVAAIVMFVAFNMFKKNATKKSDYFLILLSFLMLFFIRGDFKVFAPFLVIILYGILGYYNSPQKENSMTLETKRTSFKFNFKIILALVLLILVIVLPLLNLASDPDSLFNLGSTFGGLSLMLFGGGYVFIPMIQEVVVQKYLWLNNQQFIDGIAIGQFTPGPIVISVAFIGYYIKGIPGALVATIAIFTPPVVLTIIATKMMDFLQHNLKVKSVMKSIRLGIIGMIFYSVYVILNGTLSADLIVNVQYLFVFVAVFFTLFKYNISIVWVIFASGVFGFLFL